MLLVPPVGTEFAVPILLISVSNMRKTVLKWLQVSAGLGDSGCFRTVGEQLYALVVDS